MAADQGSLQSYASARDLLLEGLAISRRLGLAWAETYALVDLAALELRRGDYVQAERYRRQALALSREYSLHWVTAFCSMGEGHMAYERGAYAEARPALQAALALFQSVAPQWAPAPQSLLGDVALAEGEHAQADEHYRAVLSAYRDQGLPWSEPMAGDCLGIGPTLNRLGDVALARAEAEQAQVYYRQALELAAEEPYVGLKLDALARQAVCLTREGATQRAVELATLVVDHPACTNPTRKVASALLFELQHSLLPGIYAAAAAQGRTADVDTTLEECLLAYQARDRTA
jgi:tetratricopeptide (TPR) repeat protein